MVAHWAATLAGERAGLLDAKRAAARAAWSAAWMVGPWV